MMLVRCFRLFRPFQGFNCHLTAKKSAFDLTVATTTMTIFRMAAPRPKRNDALYSIGWRSKNSQMMSLADTFRVERPSAADPGRPGHV